MAMYPNGVSSLYRQADDNAALRQQFRKRLGMPPLAQRLRQADGMLSGPSSGAAGASANGMRSRVQQPPSASMASYATAPGAGPVAPLGYQTAPPPRSASTQNRAPAQRAAAASASDPEPPLYDLPQVMSGKGTGAKGLRRALMQLSAQNAKRADPMIWGLIDKLSQRAQTYDPYTLAAERAGDYEALNDSMSRATGQLDRTLRDRGLTESSYGGAAYGSLAAQGANSRADLTRGVQREARVDQQQASAQLMDLLNSLQGRHTNTAMSAANQIITDNMQQQQLAAQAGGGFDIGNFLSQTLGMAGTYFGKR